MRGPISYLQTLLDALTSGYTRRDVRNARRGLPLETNIGKLFHTFAWGLQFIHEQADKILLWDNLDNAQGAVLDRYGANFGVPRNGASDAFYRLLIKVKMLAMLSGGDIDTVQRAAAALFDVDVSEIELNEIFPAKISIHVDETLLTDEIREQAVNIMVLMKRIIAAGVGFDLSIDTTREFETTAYFLGASFIDTDVQYEPVVRPRTVTDHIYMLSAGFAYTELIAHPVTKGHRTDTSTRHMLGAAMEYTEIIIPPAQGG